jgi:hypothetical protein
VAPLDGGTSSRRGHATDLCPARPSAAPKRRLRWLGDDLGEAPFPPEAVICMTFGQRAMLRIFAREHAFHGGFWRAQIIGWGFLALFGFCVRLFVFQSLTVAIICTLVVDSLGLLLTSLMAQQSFVRFQPGKAIRSLGITAIWTMGIALLLALVAFKLRIALAPIEKPTIQGDGFTIGLMYYMSVITAWTLAYIGARADTEARSQRMHAMAAETRALRLELESLHVQIAPHFLFNALNTLVAEIGERPEVAEEMTRQLAAYLRYSLEKRGQYVGPVADELDAVEMYIRIQSLRFDERFSYSCNADPEALLAFIPHMAIQCLVENAIKHGLQAESADFKINVRVAKVHDELLIEVDNPCGSKMLALQEKSGTGLANMRRRLELRYPDRHNFSLQQRSGRTVASLSLRGRPCSE